MMQLGPDWALNPPEKCPKCTGRVKAYFINFELDKVRNVPRFLFRKFFKFCNLQVVMCENVSCDFPFNDLKGCIILGKVFS